MRAIAAIVVLPFLIGCHSFCREEAVYRPRVMVAGGGKAEALQTQVVVDLDSLATLRILECGRSGAEYNPGPMRLCLLIRIEHQHLFQFDSPRVRVTSEAGVGHDLPIGRMNYEIFSLYQRDGTEKPDSDPATPTPVPLEIDRGQRHGDGRTDRYSFDAAAPFRGARSTFTCHSPVDRLFAGEFCRRAYIARVELPEDLSRTFIVSLPGTLVDGRLYPNPTIEFAHVRERVCYSAF